MNHHPYTPRLLPRAALLLLAAAPLMAAHAQQQASNVTLYGIVDVPVRVEGNAAGNGGTLWSMGNGAWTGSRFGLRGNEDLGNGNKAFFVLEAGIDPSDGTSQQGSTSSTYGQAQTTGGRLFGRDAYVGLQTSLGALTLGHQTTLGHQLSNRFQPQANPNQASLSIFSQHHVARQDNLLKYSLDLGNFTLLASGTAGEKQYGNAWGVGGTYKTQNLDLVAFHQQMHSNAADTELRKVSGLGGSYVLTATLKGYAGFLLRDQRTGTQEDRVYTVGANYQLTPRLTLTAQHAQDRAKGLAGGATGTRKMSFVAAIYALSKRTDVYTELDHNKRSGAYTATFMGSKDRQTGLSTGVRHRF